MALFIQKTSVAYISLIVS